jgi:tetratricopeptide (TPR) repeat protein
LGLTVPSTGGSAPAPRRLDSWKEIAAYFGKDVRTVRRWESERNLPVRRLPGRERSGVFAYVEELEKWLHEDSQEKAAPIDAAPIDGVGPLSAEAEAAVEWEPAADVAISPQPIAEAVAPEAVPVGTRSGYGWKWVWLIAAVILVVAGTGAELAYRNRRIAEASAKARSTSASTDAVTQELYLRGRYLWNLRTADSLTQAVDLFTQSIVHDPRYAPAYAGLADSYLLLREYGSMADSDAYTRAYTASRQALALDEGSSEAHRTYAYLLNYWMWDSAASEREFRRAIALDPGDAQTHHWFATMLYSEGRYQEALSEIDVARSLRPDSAPILADRGLLLDSLDGSAAQAYLLEMERAMPDFAAVHRYLAVVQFRQGRYSEFLVEERQTAVLLHHAEEIALIDRARHELTEHGSAAMLRTMAEGWARKADQENSADAMSAAYYFAALRDTDRTLRYLSLACQRRESYFHSLGTTEEFAFLKGDPRFEVLKQRSSTPFASPGERVRAGLASG